MQKGASGSSKTSDQLQESAETGPGVVAGLDGLATAHSHYGKHAAALAHHAHAHGHSRLASAITSVAHTPHPQDKMQVAQNYLSTLPPDQAQAQVHMFTPHLMQHTAP